MLDGSNHQLIYLIIVTILTYICSRRYRLYSDNRIEHSGKESYIPLFVLCVCLILFIGLRPAHRVFVDMNNYVEYYNNIQTHSSGFEFDYEAENILFDNMFNFLAVNNYSIDYFFLIMSLIYFGCISWALIRLFPQDSFYSFLIYLAGFSTFSYATNGIKAGAAAALFLVAISYRSKIWLSLLIALISWGFHHSMYMVIACYAITFFVKQPKYYLYFWIVCVLLGLLQLNPFAEIMVELSDDSGAAYLTASDDEWGGKTGFRSDFLLYSAFPILIGYYVIFKRKIHDRIYLDIFNLYLICNSLWVLCMYVPFNNRIAYLSWFLLPIIIVYPLFQTKFISNQYDILNKIVWIHLGFTIFMYAVYY